MQMNRPLVAIAAYNESRHIAAVLDELHKHAFDILVVDDGSIDSTPEILRQYPRINVIRHVKNQGYGAALRAAFQFGRQKGYKVVVTMDADGQHVASWIPPFLETAESCDIVSGSRYLEDFSENTPAPNERRRINLLVTDQLNAALGLSLTDAFCGFKAYRTEALARLHLVEDGYGMPLELWIQAACLGLAIREIAVPRIYLDPNRSFGAKLDDAEARLVYYQQVIDRTMKRIKHVGDCGLPYPQLLTSFAKADA
jgi:dolichol-phosphate mannosyltransferase